MKFLLILGLFFITACTTPNLPSYVCVDDPLCKNKRVLREPAKIIGFPLSNEVRRAIRDLEAKYDNEENMAGLAAPQIGYPYRIIIFAVKDDPKIKKLRKDIIQTMPKTIWLNPTYKPLSNEKRKDIEGCFSINKYVGQVERYTHIVYSATTVEGKKVTGEAKGFLARVIQHEIDHVNGIMCLDNTDEKLDKEQYLIQRKKLIQDNS